MDQSSEFCKSPSEESRKDPSRYGTEIGNARLTVFDCCFRMKGVASVLCTVGFLVGTAVCNTMCMYTLPEEDVFEKTAWESEQVPLGPLEVCRLVVNFGRGGEVTLRLDFSPSSPRGLSSEILDGHYEHNGTTAVMAGLGVTVQGYSIKFIEADYNNDDIIFLLWQVEDILYPFTSVLYRIN